jgi:hypothetical protein
MQEARHSQRAKTNVFPKTSCPDRAAVGLACAAIIWFLFASCWFFYWAGMDDDFTTIWSGETLGRDWWFINYNGDRSEMTSSILAALVAKLAYWMAPDATFLLNKLFLFLCAPAALWLLWRYRETYLCPPHVDTMGAATIVVAASMPFLQAWAQSGMETPLHTLLLTWYTFVLISYARAPNPSSAYRLMFCQCLLILVRPEGFWAIGTTLVMLWLAHGRARISWQDAWTYLAPLLFFYLLLSCRVAATGLPFPNAAYAKVDIGIVALRRGYGQLLDFYTLSVPQWLLAFTLTVAALMLLKDMVRKPAGWPQKDIALVGLVMVIVAHAGVFLLAGGCSGMYRMLVPTTLLQCCLLFHLFSRYAAGVTRHTAAVVSTVAFLMAASYTYADNRFNSVMTDTHYPTSGDFANVRDFAWHRLVWPSSIAQLNWESMMLNYEHNRDLRALQLFFQEEVYRQLARPGELRIVTYQAGLFPYYVKHLYPDAPIRFFDMMGLMDARVGLAGREKDAEGVENDLLLVLRGSNGISGLLQEFNPNMIYEFGGAGQDEQVLLSMGWERVYARPNAEVILAKKQRE